MSPAKNGRSLDNQRRKRKKTLESWGEVSFPTFPPFLTYSGFSCAP